MYLYDYLTTDEKEQFQELHGVEFKEFRETMAKKYGKELQDALHQLPPELFELIKETAKFAERVADMLTETGGFADHNFHPLLARRPFCF